MSSATLGVRYLAYPDGFPAWDAGDPFGTGRLSMTVSGCTFNVSGLSAPQAETIRALWPGFVESDAGHDAVRLSIFRTPAGTFRKLDRWVYELDFEYDATSLRMVGVDLMARIELGRHRRGALWIATEEPETFHGAFENFLRVVVAYATLGGRGALLHSAAVVENEHAWLFIGHSGAGKSTVSRLGMSTGRSVLSDDLNPILPRESGIDLVGSPFLGDLGARSPARHALSGIYRLEQGPDDAVRPMGAAETVSSLLACSPYLNRDPYRTDELCSNLLALAERVPAHVLTFRKDGTFWPLLERKKLA